MLKISAFSLLCPSGIDKITEKAQVSEDGTMVAVLHSDSPQAAADCGAAAGGSDTESNSERDHEVTAPHITDVLATSSSSSAVKVIYPVVRCIRRSRRRRGVDCPACRHQQPGAQTQTGYGRV